MFGLIFHLTRSLDSVCSEFPLHSHLFEKKKKLINYQSNCMFQLNALNSGCTSQTTEELLKYYHLNLKL